jgi:hypothetical protein
MNNIVTWEYYNSLHNKANQGEFVSLEALAEKHVISVIGPYKWDHVQETAFYFNQLKDCICNVVDILVDFSKNGVGAGLASVSNDGYTENYVVRTSTEADAEIRSYIRHQLSGTGLTSGFPWGG